MSSPHAAPLSEGVPPRPRPRGALALARVARVSLVAERGARPAASAADTRPDAIEVEMPSHIIICSLNH